MSRPLLIRRISLDSRIWCIIVYEDVFIYVHNNTISRRGEPMSEQQKKSTDQRLEEICRELQLLRNAIGHSSKNGNVCVRLCRDEILSFLSRSQPYSTNNYEEDN